MEQISKGGNFDSIVPENPKNAKNPKNICLERGKEYYTWDNFEIQWGNPEDYEIDEFIDKGKYSYVYSGICKRD